MTDKEIGCVVVGLAGIACVATSVGLFFGAGFGFLTIGTFFLGVTVWVW